MIATFVGTWVYILLVLAAHLFTQLSDRAIQIALVPALGLVAASAALQFSERCPRCEYRIGLQSSLVVPDRCASCGTVLRPTEETPGSEPAA